LFISLLGKSRVLFNEIAVDCSLSLAFGMSAATRMRYSARVARACAARAGDANVAE